MFSVSILVVDKTGRRVLLLISGIVMAIPLATIGGFFYLFNEEGSEYTEWRGSFEWVPLVCIIIYMIGYSVGYACVPFLLLGELLPENMRNLLGINFINILRAAFLYKSVMHSFSVCVCNFLANDNCQKIQLVKC